LVILGVVVGAFTVGVLVAPDHPPADLGVADATTSVPVVTQAFEDPVSVGAVFVLGDAVPLIVRTSGTVTSGVNGSVLVSGQVAIRVDQRPIVAVSSSVVLYRDLMIGDRGQDVAGLNAELTRLGYGPFSSDVFTADTGQAWAALLAQAGVANDGRGLRLVDVLWIPDTTVPVKSWSALPGTAVKTGDVVGYTQPRLNGLELSTSDKQPVVHGDRQLTLFNVSTPMNDISVPVPDEFLRELEQTPDFASMVANDQNTGQATMTLVEPITAYRVPPGALFAVTGATGCVQNGDASVAVTIVGAGLGATLVTVSQPIDRVAVGTGITMTTC